MQVEQQEDALQQASGGLNLNDRAEPERDGGRDQGEPAVDGSAEQGGPYGP